MAVAVGFAARVGTGSVNDAVVLSGPDGRRCLVLPGSGSQLGSLALSPASGVPAVDILYTGLGEEVSRIGVSGGAPVLFPWPGRIARGAYTYRGQAYRLPGSAERHALHGFVHSVPWHLVGHGVDANGAWAKTRIEHAALGVSPAAFPGLYALDVTHRLSPDGYVHEVCASNVGAVPFPFGYGWHPYFRAPLTAGGERSECQVRVPAQARWELTSALVPTGRRLEVAGPYDLRQATRLGDKSYDDPFTLLEHDPDGGSHADLIDPLAGLQVTVAADAAFEHWVVYSPRTLGAVCLEPYTCVPDAFNLEPRGIAAGIRELDPGEEWRAKITVRLRVSDS